MITPFKIRNYTESPMTRTSEQEISKGINKLTLHKKMKFSINDFFSKCD